jgi:hypothetical protein
MAGIAGHERHPRESGDPAVTLLEVGGASFATSELDSRFRGNDDFPLLRE